MNLPIIVNLVSSSRDHVAALLAILKEAIRPRLSRVSKIEHIKILYVTASVDIAERFRDIETDPIKYDYEFQMSTFNDYISKFRNAYENSPDVIITESSYECQLMLFNIHHKLEHMTSDQFTLFAGKKGTWELGRQLVSPGDVVVYIPVPSDDIEIPYSQGEKITFPCSRCTNCPVVTPYRKCESHSDDNDNSSDSIEINLTPLHFSEPRDPNHDSNEHAVSYSHVTSQQYDAYYKPLMNSTRYVSIPSQDIKKGLSVRLINRTLVEPIIKSIARIIYNRRDGITLTSYTLKERCWGNRSSKLGDYFPDQK